MVLRRGLGACTHTLAWPCALQCSRRAVATPRHPQALKTLAEKFKDRPFSFLWAAGGSQPALEANFGIG